MVYDYPRKEEPSFALFNKDYSLYLTTSYKKESFVINGVQFNLFDLESMDHELLGKQFGFNPYCFYPETGMVIIFKCIQQTDDYYLVLVNENPINIKLLPKSNKFFQFEEWEEHILSSYINFNVDTMNFYPSPTSTQPFRLSQDTIGDEGFVAGRMVGEWMQLYGDNLGEECVKLKSFDGWIKWREGLKPLIELAYIL
jgi:hypothetical protein